MLSRVAENIYWLGRYVERAENTARIISVNANLLLDLPRGIAPGWGPLIEITGSAEIYRERYPDHEERNVLKFLIADGSNPGSIITSLSLARENARTIRDIVPREAWEHINELYYYARERLQSGLSKRGRYAYLSRIILGAQTLTGQLSGTMSQDAGYEFLRIGRNLERGDMTIRIIDVRSATLLPHEPTGLRPFENIQWMSVLKSLTAYQMYRRRMQIQVRRWDVLRFLFQDREFPRAFYHCVSEVEHSLERLARNEAALRVTGRLKRSVQGTDFAIMSQSELHQFIDLLEIGLAHLHDEITKTYFLHDGAGAEVAVAAAAAS